MKKIARYTITQKGTNESKSINVNVLVPLVEFYITKDGNKIDRYMLNDTIRLVIKSQGHQKTKFEIDLSNQDAIFEKDGKEIGKSCGYKFEHTIKTNEEEIDIKAVKIKTGWETNKNKITIQCKKNGELFKYRIKWVEGPPYVGIKTIFYNGEEKNREMPNIVGRFIYEGFGLDVDYCPDTQRLFLVDKVDKNRLSRPQSPLATARLEEALTKEVDKYDEFGVLHIGYKIKGKEDQKVYYGSSDGKNAYIDLNDFNENNFSKKKLIYNNLSTHCDDLITVFEHEYLGHVFLKKGGYGDGKAYTTGAVVDEVNKYRREREYLERLHYSYPGGDILYGKTRDFKDKKEMKEYVKNVIESGNISNYPHITHDRRDKKALE